MYRKLRTDDITREEDKYRVTSRKREGEARIARLSSILLYPVVNSPFFNSFIPCVFHAIL